MRESIRNNKNLNQEQINDLSFPKWYDLEFDNTSNLSGCFVERPGHLLMNLHIADASDPNDKSIDILNMINNEFLDKGVFD